MFGTDDNAPDIGFESVPKGIRIGGNILMEDCLSQLVYNTDMK